MNILIYIPELDQEWGGVRQYSIGLLNLIAQEHTHNYLIYHNSNDPEVQKIIERYPQLKKVKDSDVIMEKKGYVEQKFINLYNRIARRLNLKQTKAPLSFIDTLCLQFDINIIHCPYQYIPYTEKAKLITTMHDIQEIHFPEYFKAEIRAFRANAYLDYIRRSDAIIVSYNHVKKDLIKYFDVTADKVTTLLLKMDNLWIERYTDITDLNRFNLPTHYLLYPANTWKHKNHLSLLEAIAKIRDKYNVKINIICTGFKNENYEEIEKSLNNLSLQDQVQFVGVVSEEELYSLYKTSKGVVIPTIYEAGSFPLYESIFLNIPVVCSNVTSLPETIGADEFIFDPYNIEEMADKIHSLWTDSDFKQRNLKQIELQARVIKSNNPLPTLLSMYNKLI